MSDTLLRLFEMYGKGLNCSQMMIELGLQDMGRENPMLVQSVAALGGGVGFTGLTCGALTGAACLLSLLTLHEQPDGERDDIDMLVKVNKLVDWFEAKVGEPHGGTNCADIIAEQLEGRRAPAACVQIVADTYDRVREVAGAEGS